MMKLITALFLLCSGLFFAPSARAQHLPLETIRLPPGFHITVFAEVPDARSMTLGTRGTLFIGTRDKGAVYAIAGATRDAAAGARKVIKIATDLNEPNGVAFKDGALYVAEVNRILRFDDIEQRLENPPKPAVVTDSYPKDKSHGWKFIAFGPDGKLYVPVGAPCNVCDEKDPIYASITRINRDGSGREIYARGIRNTVGFDWHPTTKELWFTDNGRDMMGDDVPDDELNWAPKAGLHFGFPYIHQGDTPDPEYGKAKKAQDYVAPVAKLGPHVAALGMRFYTGKMFPEEYRNQIFIAEHGSWNRSTPIGYRVTLVKLNGRKSQSYEPFAQGWLDSKTGRAWGRPVDVLVMPDGALLVSDDKADVIYRITYSKK